MLSYDPAELVSYRQQDLLAEAQSERLLAMLPERQPLHLRRKLAQLCVRLAGWLDEPPSHAGVSHQRATS